MSSNKHSKQHKQQHNKHIKQAKRAYTKNISVETYFNVIIPILFKRLTDADGVCYNPHSKNPRIIIDNSLLTKRKLNVIIEEITHGFFFDLPEYKVRKFSAQLGKVIYHLFIKK